MKMLQIKYKTSLINNNISYLCNELSRRTDHTWAYNIHSIETLRQKLENIVSIFFSRYNNCFSSVIRTCIQLRTVFRGWSVLLTQMIKSLCLGMIYKILNCRVSLKICFDFTNNVYLKKNTGQVRQ